jgi:hypothetical protein
MAVIKNKNQSKGLYIKSNIEKEEGSKMISYKKKEGARELIRKELLKSNPNIGFVEYLKEKYGV